MTCNNNSNFNVNQKIIILPEGCSEKDVISLQCKAPDEAIFYQFSLGNRLSSSDTIIDVCAGITYEAVIVDYISFTGKTFKCRISGGELNTKAGIVFKVITKQGEQREFNVTLPIAPVGSYVIGNTGPQGNKALKEMLV